MQVNFTMMQDGNMACYRCGALVPPFMTDIHAEWHHEVDPAENEQTSHVPLPVATSAHLNLSLCVTCGEKIVNKQGVWQHFGVGKPYENVEIR